MNFGIKLCTFLIKAPIHLGFVCERVFSEMPNCSNTNL